MSRKIYNRLSFMAVSWLDESTLLLAWRILAVAHLTSYNEVFVAARLYRLVQARNSPYSRQETANHTWKQHKYSTAS
jgi:hypothetical protein